MPLTGRLGVLADVHANAPALEAAIAAVARHHVEHWICTGDIVGYGAEPTACVRRLRELGALCVAGNHDLMAIGELSDDGVPALARDAIRWTRATLGPNERAWLAALPRRAALGPIAVAHGSLDDPERYVLTAADAATELSALAPDERLLLLGHTHVPLAAAERSGVLDSDTRRPVALPPEERTALNPGAVGQSREQVVQARALVLDLDRREAQFVAVPYDVERARAALRACGLDERGVHLPPPPGWLRTARSARRSARRSAARVVRRARRSLS